ncbi:MAG: SDR family NAD(P)-dependent oxidoreductase [Halobacteriaceae archaeon]
MTTERAEVGAGVDGVDLAGATALVTGATSGVGREVALALGRLGARVLVHGRNEERGAAVVAALRETTTASFHRAEFASLDDVRGLAAAVREESESLDVLVNNAGAHFSEGRLAACGVERTFAVNHLAPFLLTNLLRPALADGGRVVTVSSEVHRQGALDLDAVESAAGYDGLDAYARSKLANVLFTRELAHRLEGAGDDAATANCCHPGFVPGSGLWREASLPVRAAVGALARLPRPLLERVADTAVTAAETPVYLAAAPDVDGVTGRYFRDREVVEPAAAARDDALAGELWRASAEWTGLGG